MALHHQVGGPLGTSVAAVSLGYTGNAFAETHPWDHHYESGGGDHHKPQSLQATPWVFVGTAQQCGGTPGSNIVTSAWLRGMGLPDNGAPNSPDPSARRDPHTGLLLNKNGPTSDACSAAGASIDGFKSGRTITELGFDYRFGGHCLPRGTPRFNITTMAGNSYFAGCARGAQTTATQDGQWVRVRFADGVGIVDPADPANPPFQFGTTRVKSIDIVYDEGTDTASDSDPNGVGLAVLDNIDIGGKLITSGQGIQPRSQSSGHGDGDEDDQDNNDGGDR